MWNHPKVGIWNPSSLGGSAPAAIDRKLSVSGAIEQGRGAEEGLRITGVFRA